MRQRLFGRHECLHEPRGIRQEPADPVGFIMAECRYSQNLVRGYYRQALGRPMGLEPTSDAKQDRFEPGAFAFRDRIKPLSQQRRPAVPLFAGRDQRHLRQRA